MKKSNLKSVILSLIFLYPAFALSSELIGDKGKDDLILECEANKKYLNLSFDVECGKAYHHYNSKAVRKNYSSVKAQSQKNVKISEFNALHPGMGKTKFKDFSRVAKIINEFDIVGVTELIPLVDADLTNNDKVIDFLNNTPSDMKDIKKKIAGLEASLKKPTRGEATKRRNLALFQKQLLQMEEDLQNVQSLYRAPGYLKILLELHKLDDGDEWALILNPKGEASEKSPSPELVGYFYRSSVVKPKTNEYCKALKSSGRIRSKESPYACTIQMDRADMGVDKSMAFSRRPFLGEFMSGKFSFTLVTSHVLFDEPNDPYLQMMILEAAFGVKDYLDLKPFGKGATKSKYARFAEVKMTLDFISRFLKKYNKNEDIIFMGDFNLEKDNPFWEYVLSFWKDSQIFIDENTSVSAAKYKGKEETFGGSSNYDHFIFNPKQTSECVPNKDKKMGVLNFTQGRQANYINRSYLIRKKTMKNSTTYREDSTKKKRVIERFVTPVVDGDSPILTVGKIDILHKVGGKVHRKSSTGITIDTKETDDFQEDFLKRVLNSQLNIKSYYYYFAQLVSDHFPIYMECSTR